MAVPLRPTPPLMTSSSAGPSSPPGAVTREAHRMWVWIQGVLLLELICGPFLECMGIGGRSPCWGRATNPADEHVGEYPSRADTWAIYICRSPCAARRSAPSSTTIIQPLNTIFDVLSCTETKQDPHVSAAGLEAPHRCPARLARHRSDVPMRPTALCTGLDQSMVKQVQTKGS